MNQTNTQCFRTARWFAITALFVLPNLLDAHAIFIGSTRQDVINAYGFPMARAGSSRKEVFKYKEGQVTIVDNVVTDIQFTKGEPRILEPSAPPPEETPPQKATPPPPAVQAPAAVPVKTPPPVSIAATPEPPPAPAAPEPSAFGLPLTLGLLASLPLAGGLLFLLRKRRKRAADVAPQQAEGPHETQQLARIVRLPYVPRQVTFLTRTHLDRLEWKPFEEMIRKYFESQGWVAQRAKIAMDGSTDILLFRKGEHQPSACVLCKPWSSRTVCVEELREFTALMASDRITQGYVVITDDFSPEAKAYAEKTNLELISGDELLHRFKYLPDLTHAAIVRQVFVGDFETPTCPHCDVKMVRHGDEDPFWSCPQYPRCDRHFPVRRGTSNTKALV